MANFLNTQVSIISHENHKNVKKKKVWQTSVSLSQHKSKLDYLNVDLCHLKKKRKKKERKEKSSCVTQTNQLCAGLCGTSCGGTPARTCGLFVSGMQLKNLPVNQTEVIRNCLHRRRTIVCQMESSYLPKCYLLGITGARFEIPSQIKSQFSSWYLIPSTHLISCSYLRSCLRAEIREQGERNAAILLLTD